MAPSNHKRPLESSTNCGEEGGQRHSKRPAPSTSNLQNHGINGTPGYISLDDIRQVVQEEMEQAIKLLDSHIQIALKGLIPQINSSLKNAIREPVCKGMDHANPQSLELVKRTLPIGPKITDTRNMQLHFKSKFSLRLCTTLSLQEQLGCPIQIELIDANTSSVVTSGPESSAKLDVVVLEGDFNKEDNNTWSLEDFVSSMVKECQGRGPLLCGKLHVNLVDGVGELGDLKFTDNSSWNSSGKFRIGVKVASGFCEDLRVQEAVTEAFTVREHRGESYKKHHPPEADDEVWRLEKIGKDGAYCKRLNEKGVHKVEEFLRLLAGDSTKLRNILGSGMTQRKWKVLINHANTCRPKNKSYVYYCDDQKNDGVVINNLCQLKGLIIGEVYHPTEQLSDYHKVQVDNLVKAASKNWHKVTEFRAESFLPTQSLIACPVEAPMQSPVPLSGDSIVGFHNVNHNQSLGFIPQSSILSPNTSLTSIISEQDTQQETIRNENMQCTEPHGSLPFNGHTSSPSSDLDRFIEELLSSDNSGGNIMPENVDTQNPFNNLGTGSSSIPHIGRAFRKGNGRAVVCWYMVKAIFRWGYFRKKVNKRIMELDQDNTLHYSY